jgi:hypothetical protein
MNKRISISITIVYIVRDVSRQMENYGIKQDYMRARVCVIRRREEWKSWMFPGISRENLRAIRDYVNMWSKDLVAGVISRLGA